jgi:hypothetical protein
MMEILSWAANILAITGWVVNIKRRKQAMMIFTVATMLSVVYFWHTRQWAFLARMAIYLVIDMATLWHIRREP